MIGEDSTQIHELPSHYLELFSELKNPPNSLYFTGKLELLAKRKVAIVGSRRASQYARVTTKKLASHLSSLGCVIVSGAAMGIDACAHEGADGNTIAVFGNSLDKIYPAVNKPLIDKIYSNSLALSEYQKDTMPTNYSFVLRNRIVVVMSEVLIVAEADEDSGSMRSVEVALKLGRPVYVLPHRMGESSGTARLARDGLAKVLYDFDIITNDLALKSLISSNAKNDALIDFCKTSPSLDEAVRLFGELVYEYELDGKMEIINNKAIAKI